MLDDVVDFRVDVLRCCTLGRNRLIAEKKKSWIRIVMPLLNQDIYNHEMQRNANSIKIFFVVKVWHTWYDDGDCVQNSARSV